MPPESIIARIGAIFPSRVLVVVLPPDVGPWSHGGMPAARSWQEDIDDLCADHDDEAEDAPPGPVADQVSGRYTLLDWQRGIYAGEGTGELRVAIRANQSMRLSQLILKGEGLERDTIVVAEIWVGNELVFTAADKVGVPVSAFSLPALSSLLLGRRLMAGTEIAVLVRLQGPAALFFGVTGTPLT